VKRGEEANCANKSRPRLFVQIRVIVQISVESSLIESVIDSDHL